MEELRKVEGLSIEELEAQRVELLPDREEMQTTINVYNYNIGSFAMAEQGAQSGEGQANQSGFTFNAGTEPSSPTP